MCTVLQWYTYISHCFQPRFSNLKCNSNFPINMLSRIHIYTHAYVLKTHGRHGFLLYWCSLTLKYDFAWRKLLHWGRHGFFSGGWWWWRNHYMENKFRLFKSTCATVSLSAIANSFDYIYKRSRWSIPLQDLLIYHIRIYFFKLWNVMTYFVFDVTV